MASRVLISNVASRQDDWISGLILEVFTHAAIEFRLNPGTVLRVNSVEPKRRFRDVLAWPWSVCPLDLGRAFDGVVRDVETPPACVTQTLDLEEECLASTQMILCPLDVVDVDQHHEPPRYLLMVVPDGKRA